MKSQKMIIKLEKEVERLRSELELSKANVQSLQKALFDVAFRLGDKLDETQAELAAAKAASVVPVEIVPVIEDADLDHGYNIDVGIQCKSEADANTLLDWLRDRTKENT